MKRSRPVARPGRIKGAEMAELRQATLERDKGHCQLCGRTVNPTLPPEDDTSFHLAHRRGKRMWGDHIDQVEVNCGLCHRLFHSYGKTMKKPCPKK